MDDWLKIKTEYITTDISYRKLAEKFGIHYQSIAKVGKAEGWGELRKQHRDKTLTKTVEKISSRQARTAARVSDLADKLLSKLEQAIGELDMQVTTYTVKTESGSQEQTRKYQVAEAGGIVDRAGLRQLTAALQQLQQIKGELPELDRQEQEARIANLRRTAEQGDKTAGTVTVRLEGGLEDYAQ